MRCEKMYLVQFFGGPHGAWTESRMNNAVKAGAVYFIAVFAVAFMFGTLRVLVLAPRLGPVPSVLIETPFILGVSWFTARWATAKYVVAPILSARLAMGAVAFALLMIVEFAMATLGFGTPMTAYFAAFLSLQGVIGLGAQIAFALLPAIQPLPKRD